MAHGSPLPATRGFTENWDIHISSKAGDLLRVKYLVEQLDQDVNEHDVHNSSPLFYACLCGHIGEVLTVAWAVMRNFPVLLGMCAPLDFVEVVKYLLDCGSRLIPGLFETERCFYGALTTEIRDILLKHKANPNKFDNLVQNMQGLRSMLLHTDFALNVHAYEGEEVVTKLFPLHRFILAARSPWFAERFEGVWKRESEVTIVCAEDAIFGSITLATAMLDFLYASVIDIDEDECDRLAELCNTMGYLQVADAIRQEKRRKDRELRRIVLKIEKERLRLTKDMGKAFVYENSGSNLARPIGNAWPDVCLELEDEAGTKHTYECHKALLCQHSAYFHAMISGHFKEARELRSSNSEGLPRIQMSSDLRPDLLRYAVSFLYTNTLYGQLDDENTIALMALSDQLLLMELKRLCAVRLRKSVSQSNVFAYLRLGELYQIRVLRQACLDFAEHNIIDLWHTEAFTQALKELSFETTQELRFYVSERVPDAVLPPAEG